MRALTNANAEFHKKAARNRVNWQNQQAKKTAKENK